MDKSSYDFNMQSNYEIKDHDGFTCPRCGDEDTTPAFGHMECTACQDTDRELLLESEEESAEEAGEE